MADTYDVTGQRKTYGAMPDGSFGRVIEVTFTTKSGVQSSVMVSADNYNADNVRAAIEKHVTELLSVQQL
jgi:hypothetical protein